jgi:hypothetical protein
MVKAGRLIPAAESGFTGAARFNPLPKAGLSPPFGAFAPEKTPSRPKHFQTSA